MARLAALGLVLAACAGVRPGVEVGRARPVEGVAIACTPPDAEVYVDGSLRGRARDYDGTSGYLALTGGSHLIELRARGYAPERLTVEPGGALTTVSVTLHTL